MRLKSETMLEGKSYARVIHELTAVKSNINEKSKITAPLEAYQSFKARAA